MSVVERINYITIQTDRQTDRQTNRERGKKVKQKNIIEQR